VSTAQLVECFLQRAVPERRLGTNPHETDCLSLAPQELDHHPPCSRLCEASVLFARRYVQLGLRDQPSYSAQNISPRCSFGASHA